MHYLITGATGLIGTVITQKLLAENHLVTVLTRNKNKAQRHFNRSVNTIEKVHEITSDTTIDAVINLAGAPIADVRWTDNRKRILEHSRIDFTQTLLEDLLQHGLHPECIISGSAVGFYGDGGNKLLTEHSAAKADYAHYLCHKWEQAAFAAEQYGIRVCIVRTGLVLAPNGGFLQRMLLPFKLGLGGRIGDGKQYMPWIHINDISKLLIFLSQNPLLTGVFNGTAPHPVTNEEFAKTLASLLHRPAFFPVPASLLQLLLGEMSSLLLTGQNAIPTKAQASGFKFEYTDLEPALINVIY